MTDPAHKTIASLVAFVHNRRFETIETLKKRPLKTLRYMQSVNTEAAWLAYRNGDLVAFERYDQRLSELAEAVLQKEFIEEV